MIASGTLMTVFAAACGDRSADMTAPATASEASPAPAASASGGLVSGLLTGVGGVVSDASMLLPAVLRLQPLLQDVMVSQEVGPEGGVVRAGDVTLRIPEGALTGRTKITVVVPAGLWVQAYFTPHGLRFQKPVSLTFDLRGSSWGDSELVGAYFVDPILRGLIPAREVLPAVTADGQVTFWIEHFSFYAPARRGYTAAGGD
jgi:hypothetical protein